jgi:putative transposase
MALPFWVYRMPLYQKGAGRDSYWSRTGHVAPPRKGKSASKACTPIETRGLAMLKRYEHRPAHLLLDRTSYFITGSIYQKRELLSDALKGQLISLLQQTFSEFSWVLEHWVVLSNHYHLLAFSDKGTDLPKIIGRVHYRSGQAVRKNFPSNLPVWWNYWDYCPRDEKDYVIRLNYLLHNPVKHGYTDNLYNYPFSSFHQHINKTGRESLYQHFIKHKDYHTLVLDEDDF